MHPKGKFLNMGVPILQAAGRDIVDGSVAGTTNDAVLRFNAANDAAVGDGISIVHSATLGDSVEIRRGGLYFVSLIFSQAASTTVMLGISLNVAAAGLTGNPVTTIAGMGPVGDRVLPASNTQKWQISSVFSIPQAVAQLPAVVRFHGTNGSNAVIPDATILDNTECSFLVFKIAELA